MVRETKTLGEGRSADTQPEQLPTVKNIAVYDSTRMITDWELAFVIEKITESQNSHKFYHKMQAILGRDFVSNLDSRHAGGHNYSSSYYQIIISWKRRQTNGLAEVGAVAKLLREIQFQSIAEALEP